MNEENLFQQVLTKPPAERAAFLEEACGGDAALRQRVEVLLHAHEYPGSFLAADSPLPFRGRRVGGEGGITLDYPIAERPGTVIGPYKLLEQIGEGGFGVVFMAEQTHPVRRKVALKILKPGMDTRQVVARFEAERQALAIMDHPNIAKVFDGGSTRQGDKERGRHGDSELSPVSLSPCLPVSLSDPGRPYFVMELVRGVPITEFCDQNHLTPRQRLELFVPVCQAVQHAHQKGIIHRDLKPSNILVTVHDTTPVPKVIDFGVAKALGQVLTDKTLFTGFAQMIGTPTYMSPEQAGYSGLDIDTRSDIYALGVLLYELLTGTTPFDKERMKDVPYDDLRRILKEEEPPRPSTRMSTLGPAATMVSANRQSDPRKLSRLFRGELDWIVMKCLEKDRNRRYETANGAARDVERYLHDEPVQARPPSKRYLMGKFVRKNKRAAGMAATVLLLLVFGIVGTSWGMRQARTAAAEAEENARTQRREALIQEIQRIRLTRHGFKWSDRAWGLVTQAADIRGNKLGILRDHAVPTLIGVDARLNQDFPNVEASSLAFGPNGQLLMGGVRGKGAMLWDGTINAPVVSKQTGPGPVIFKSDGTPLQAAMLDYYTYRLHDMSSEQSTEFKIRIEEPRATGPRQVWPKMALAPDGQYFAASPTLPDGKGALAIWDGPSGKRLQQFPEKATALAFTPAEEGKKMLLAAGHEDGRITIWSLPEVKEVASFPAGRMQVNALAFRRDLHRTVNARPDAETTGWLLAVGEKGGRLVIWDVNSRLPITYCHGSSNDIHAVAFSPDGMTLASAGRGRGYLWDVATGQPILDLEPFSFTLALAFNSDGSKLAFAEMSAFDAPAGVGVLQIEPGRGTQTLRGLAGRNMRIWFSPNGQLLAALSHDWELGIWDLEKNRLIHVIELPLGPFIDNAGFAFNADGSRFAFAGGERATLWETSTGDVLDSWSLPPGLGDQVAFHPSGKLLSFRWETEDGKQFPTNLARWPDHPRVVRIRELKASKELKAIKEIKDFSRHVHADKATFDGSFFVVEGVGGPEGETRMIKCFEGPTGKELWPKATPARFNGSWLTLDPAGRTLTLKLEDDARTSPLFEVATGKPLGTLAKSGVFLGPDASFWGHESALYRRQDKEPLISIAIDSQNTGMQFSSTGHRLAWGNVDGSIVVCDLNEVQTRLATVGLGW